jgi:hypothetical protein
MKTATQTVATLMHLPDMGEVIIDGAIWTKFASDREFKVSPKGRQGDYDTGCYWVDYDELDDRFPMGKTFEVGRV